MTLNAECPGIGRKAVPGDGRAVCPVCKRGTTIGLPRRFRKGIIVPAHEMRQAGEGIKNVREA